MNTTAVIQFAVLGLPQPKGSMRAFAFVNKATGKARAVVTAGNNAKGTKAWANLVTLEAQRHAPTGGPWDGPIRVHLGFAVQAPRSLRKSVASFATKKPDLDKLARNVLDALTGVLFRDDAQVVDLMLTKQYGHRPCVSVCVVRADADLALGYRPHKED